MMLVHVLLLTAWAAAADWEPDRWPPPAAGVDTHGPTAPAQQGLVLRLYHWYHTRISPKDGARCPYYPTCSAYAVIAYRERGPLVGSMLTIDRLLREYPWMGNFDHYPIVTPHKTPRFHDPVPSRKSNDEKE